MRLLIPEEDLKTSRQTVINWPLFVKTVADGYRTNGQGVPHGVQKDAIQNSWDAKDPKGKNWSIKFELFETKETNFLTIEDHGTFGLTGRILKHEELQEDLPREERWGRFENLAFIKEPSSNALGSRGRGKFIFVGASGNNTIFYDTLRDDGLYRFGFRTIKLTESPINAFNDREGRNKFVTYTKGILAPLKQTGTRIIIVNPIDELLKDIKSGRFLRYIGETWWEIISKYDANIEVIFDNKVFKATIPPEFLLGAKEDKNRKVWLKRFQELIVGNKKYRIKEFYVVCDKSSPVPEDLRGISIQRGGMKICSIPLDYAPKDISKSLFGYITLDQKLDRELIPDEGVEHYSFDFRNTTPKSLKRFIQDELTEFGKQKLGLGVDVRQIENERHTNAEKKALIAINLIANKLGLFKRGLGYSSGSSRQPNSLLPIKLEMTHFKFPHGINRVDYGETIENVNLGVLSRKENPVKTKVQLFVLFGDRTVWKFLERDFLVKSGRVNIFGPESQKIERVTYDHPGKYTIRARLVSLEEQEKGTLLDEISRHFYIEQDPPPLGGIFEDCKGAEFPKEVSHLMSDLNLGSRRRSYILVYNKNHLAKKAIDQDENLLTDYIFRLMTYSLPEIDLRENGQNQILFEKPKTGQLDPEEIAKQFPDVISKIFHTYYSR